MTAIRIPQCLDQPLASENNLVVCVNGFYQLQLSQVEKLPAGVIICSLQTAIEKHFELVKKYWLVHFDANEYPPANDGLFLYFPDHCKIAQPIYILSIVS